jgi:hypothetical protein
VSLPFAFFLPSLLLDLPPSLSATIISVLLHFYVVLLDSFFYDDLPLSDGDPVLWQD